jgi:hypothetical protein
MQGSGETPRRLALNGLQVVASLVAWWHRWLQATLEQRSSLACLEDRSSRPKHSPRLLPASEQVKICAARRRSGWGPRLIAGETGQPHATVWRTLKRAGISRPPKQPRETPRLYEWPCPGDLLHIDSKRFARFSLPGHAVTGDRYRSGPSGVCGPATNGCTRWSTTTPVTPTASSTKTRRQRR